MDIITRIQHFIRQYQSLHSLAQGAATAFILRVTGFALNFLFSIVMVRLIGANGSGIYYLSFAIISFVASVSRLGLSDAILRFVAENLAQSNFGGIVGVTKKSIFASTLVSIPITMIVFFSAPSIANIFSEPELTNILRIMSLAIMPIAVTHLYASMLRGTEKIFASMFVSSPLLPFVSLLIVYPLFALWSLNGVAISYTISTFITYLVAMALWYYHTPFLREVSADFPNKRLIETARPLLWVTLLNSLLATIDIPILGLFADSTSVGIYGVARRAVGLIQFFVLAINVVVAPRFSILYSQNKLTEFRGLARLVAFVTTSLAIPAVLPFILFPKFILSVFGSEFIIGAPVLIILALGQFIDMTTGTITYVLMMAGYEKSVRNIMILTVLTNLITLVLLSAQFGIKGTAVAVVLTTIVLNYASVIEVYRHLSVLVLPIPNFKKLSANL